MHDGESCDSLIVRYQTVGKFQEELRLFDSMIDSSSYRKREFQSGYPTGGWLP